MDLTARDPSKVPRCILSRFAGVSEAQGERESAGEILSAAFARRISALSRFAGVNQAREPLPKAFSVVDQQLQHANNGIVPR
jgi:hypothetical protein